MTRKILKNKPLVEAIFELRWKHGAGHEGNLDPHYPILLGSLYSKLRTDFPFHEPLPAATMPLDIAGNIIQHRFRKAQGQWPLVQVGPGVLTINDTEGYLWDNFEQMISSVINALLVAHPEPEGLRIDTIMLRYIDAVTFDYGSYDIFNFLSEKMKTKIELLPQLFEGTGVSRNPGGFDSRFLFPCAKPEGVISLRFFKGKKSDIDALIWETMVQSAGEQGKQMTSDHDTILQWVSDAHLLTSDWFFKLIAGELERRFE